jgi:hypothetical protein
MPDSSRTKPSATDGDAASQTVSLAPGWVPGSAHEYGAALEQRRARGRFENLFEKGAALFGGPTPPIPKHSYTRQPSDTSARKESFAMIDVLVLSNTIDWFYPILFTRCGSPCNSKTKPLNNINNRLGAQQTLCLDLLVTRHTKQINIQRG